MVTVLYIRIYQNRQSVLDELNRELSERNEALMRYDQMKTDFLGTVAHELKTPLTVISASAADTLDLLEETLLNVSEMDDNQKRIEKTVRRIDKIVLDIMDTAAIENGRLSLSRHPAKLEETVRGICDAQFSQIDKNGNRLVYDVQLGLAHIWIDEERIKQVMTNLLSNAVRYTKNGVITVGISEKSGVQTVSVTDSGEGMDGRMINEAMNRYVSSDADNWRRGIGLYICRQIITAHGGKIWVESEKGKGTKISFSLSGG